MSSPLKLKRLIKNIDSNTWFISVEFETQDGVIAESRFDRSILANTKRFHEILLQHGAAIPADFQSAKISIETLRDSKCNEMEEETSFCGWHDDRFVTQHNTLGNGTPIKLETPDPDAPQGLQKGNLKAYLAGITPLVKSSRIVKTFMGAQCASVVSGKLDRQVSAILHSSGDSGEGKSLALAVAASFVGRASKGDIPNHAMTVAGFERRLALNRHSLAIFDELGVKGDDAKAQIRHLEKMTFGFTAGHGRTLAADGFGKKTKTTRHNQFGASSGEVSGRDLARIAKVKTKPGFSRRFIDNPMASKKDGGICDITIDGELLSEDERHSAILQASKAITQNYGVALPRFIDWILDQKNLANQYDAVIKQFFEKFGNPGGWEGEFIEVYAAVAAGGVLGVRAGVLPVSETSFIASIVKICRRAMEYAQVDQVDTVGTLNKFKRVASGQGACPLLMKGEELNKAQLRDCLGFRRKIDNRTILHVKREKLIELTGDSNAVNAFVKKCDSNGLMLDAKTRQAVMAGAEARYYRFLWFKLFPK